MGYEIRAVKIDDVKQVIDIEQSCFPIPWENEFFWRIALFEGNAHFENSEIFMDVLSEGNFKIIGYVVCILSMERKEGHLANIAIHPAYRRRGWGTKIMQHVLKRMKGNKLTFCKLEVRESNEPAKMFYKKLGFREVGRIKDYYKTEDALILHYNL